MKSSTGLRGDLSSGKCVLVLIIPKYITEIKSKQNVEVSISTCYSNDLLLLAVDLRYRVSQSIIGSRLKGRH